LDAATGKSKGFGFVLFPSAEAGQAALEALNGNVVTVNRRNFHLVLQPSKHDGHMSCAESNALYIRNIPMSASRDDINKFLSQCCEVSYSVMRPDNYGSPVWVAYVEYDCTDCAKKSLKMFHGNNSYFSSPLPILAKFADSNEVKDDRRKRRTEVTEAIVSPVKEIVLGLPNCYRHNPYNAVVIGGSVTPSPVVHHAPRKVSPQVGPWISIASC
jgi:RNA recognition motif-containing protein